MAKKKRKKQGLEREQAKPLVRRFWRTARGFWSAKKSWKVAWLMTAVLIALVVGQLIFQYQLNVWNKTIFDALEKKDSATVLRQSLIFIPLAMGSIAVAVAWFMPGCACSGAGAPGSPSTR